MQAQIALNHTGATRKHVSVRPAKATDRQAALGSSLDQEILQLKQLNPTNLVSI